MLRLAIAALAALSVTAVSAFTAGADGGIGVIDGPFPSSFADAHGIAQYATCQVTTRVARSDGTHYELAECHFLPGAYLPRSGTAEVGDMNSELPFWSDYTYEVSGELELSTSWRVVVYPDGSLVAESTYSGLDPLFPGFIASVIPALDGGTILLSQDGLLSQRMYGISDEDIAHAFEHGLAFQYLDPATDGLTAGIWDASQGLLISMPAGNRLATVTLTDAAYVSSLPRP